MAIYLMHHGRFDAYVEGMKRVIRSSFAYCFSAVFVSVLALVVLVGRYFNSILGIILSDR